MDVYIGFDSAWTDNAKAPGAISAVGLDSGQVRLWEAPRLVSFAGALAFIREVRSADGVTLVALDQPTVVPNATDSRPVEKVAASVISWMGGGVQPSNTGRRGMFCAASPVWGFLAALGATEDPEAARVAGAGLYLMEVFPALALASLSEDFFGRLAGPRYNPARRKTFRMEDWRRVANAAAREAERFGCAEVAEWCRVIRTIEMPRKADQDRLDAVLCLLIGLRWRLGEPAESMMIGNLVSGYIVLPVSSDVRTRLDAAAAARTLLVN